MLTFLQTPSSSRRSREVAAQNRWRYGFGGQLVVQHYIEKCLFYSPNSMPPKLVPGGATGNELSLHRYITRHFLPLTSKRKAAAVGFGTYVQRSTDLGRMSSSLPYTAENIAQARRLIWVSGESRFLNSKVLCLVSESPHYKTALDCSVMHSVGSLSLRPHIWYRGTLLPPMRRLAIAQAKNPARFVTWQVTYIWPFVTPLL